MMAAKLSRWAFGLLLLAWLTAGAQDDYDSLFRQAEEDSRAGKYQDAIDRYTAALRLRPGSPEALSNLAVMYYATGGYPHAWDLAEQALKARPGITSAALIAGLSAVRCNRFDDAVAPFQEVLKADPANRDALLGLAAAKVGSGRLEEAAALYIKRTNVSPDDADALYGQAICYERLAEAAAKDLSGMPGAAAYSKRLLGEFLLARGDTQLAREAFGESRESPGGGSRAAQEEYQKAEGLAGKSRQAFTRFVALAPESWQAQLFLGDVERQHRNFPAALEHYRKAEALEPQSPGPLLGEGTVHWELGEFDAAEQSLRQALRLNPGALQATFEIANIAVREHRDADAVPLLETYLVSQPDALAARADLGRAYLHLGRHPEAVEQLKLALPVDNRGEIHYQLATALKKLGREREAAEALRESSEIRAAAFARERKRNER